MALPRDDHGITVGAVEERFTPDALPPKPPLPLSVVPPRPPLPPDVEIPPVPPLPASAVVDHPITDDPITDDPITDDPITDDPITDDPTTDEPDLADVPVSGEPVADESDVDAVVAEESAPEAIVEPVPEPAGTALALRGVVKQFGDTRAVDGIDLTIPTGAFYGIVGPNGAGKTTTLSMIAGLLTPDRGSIRVGGHDARTESARVKRMLGVLPDRLRTFDRLTGRQLLYYYGVLRGLKPVVVETRIVDLARAFDLTDSLGRPVSDYSAGMTKKVMLAGAMIHSPRVLVLDEPFEAVDPVSSDVILEILTDYVSHGGTVVLSSHSIGLIERVCTQVAVLVGGQVLAEGDVDEVRGELSLEQRFFQLAGGLVDVEGVEWLHTFSD